MKWFQKWKKSIPHFLFYWHSVHTPTMLAALTIEIYLRTPKIEVFFVRSSPSLNFGIMHNCLLRLHTTFRYRSGPYPHLAKWGLGPLRGRSVARNRSQHLCTLPKFSDGDDRTKKYFKFRRSIMDFDRWGGLHTWRMSGVPVEQKNVA